MLLKLKKKAFINRIFIINALFTCKFIFFSNPNPVVLISTSSFLSYLQSDSFDTLPRKPCLLVSEEA